MVIVCSDLRATTLGVNAHPSFCHSALKNSAQKRVSVGSTSSSRRGDRPLAGSPFPSWPARTTTASDQSRHQPVVTQFPPFSETKPNYIAATGPDPGPACALPTLINSLTTLVPQNLASLAHTFNKALAPFDFYTHVLRLSPPLAPEPFL